MKNINNKIRDELFVLNEYEVLHQDPDAKASDELIKAFAPTSRMTRISRNPICNNFY